MKLEVAKKLVESAEALGLDGVSLREGYSGRGMYGTVTAGIVVDGLGDLLKCVALAAGTIARYEDEEPEEGTEKELLVDLIAELGRLRADSMGKSLIVY